MSLSVPMGKILRDIFSKQSKKCILNLRKNICKEKATCVSFQGNIE